MPAVSEEMVALSPVDRDHLENGRAVYRQACANCHDPIAVRGKSAAYWTGYVPHMADHADLLPADQADLLNYLVAAQLEATPRKQRD
ncbi:hypothetical protein Hsar01_02443 [Haloferula sargassicola]|uniref:Cytochrome c domain-containing protein n=2 Tax=Haloferula sargassicola TaxID=490096 RepID=A0ABP9UV27_9BACT